MLRSSASARRRSATRRHSTLAKLSYATSDCRPTAEKFVHLGVNGFGDLCSGQLVAGCEAVIKNSVEHNVGCYKAALVLPKLFYHSEELVDELW